MFASRRALPVKAVREDGCTTDDLTRGCGRVAKSHGQLDATIVAGVAVFRCLFERSFPFQCNEMPVALRNKMAQVFALVFVADYLTHWTNFFEEARLRLLRMFCWVMHENAGILSACRSIANDCRLLPAYTAGDRSRDCHAGGAAHARGAH